MIPTTLFTSAAAASGGTTGFILQMVPLVLIFIVFYFLLIRPQQTRMKAHAAKIGAAKRGDVVVTGGGLIGKITKVDEAQDEVEVEIASGIKVRAVRSTLADVRTGTAKPAND
jgi:preprotein translocase subunit YajC